MPEEHPPWVRSLGQEKLEQYCTRIGGHIGLLVAETPSDTKKTWAVASLRRRSWVAGTYWVAASLGQGGGRWTFRKSCHITAKDEPTWAIRWTDVTVIGWSPSPHPS
jgi:predicted amidohydrolase